jgi:hypothetical protein
MFKLPFVLSNACQSPALQGGFFAGAASPARMTAMSEALPSTDEIKTLIDRWCDRHEYRALHIVLDAWLAFNGLSEGWASLRDALRSAYALCPNLPAEERELLKTYYIQIDAMMRGR